MKHSATKRYLIFFVTSLIIFIAEAVCASESLLQDPTFVRGYEVMSPLRDIYTDHSHSEAIHQLKDSNAKPVWRLVQWGSHKTIAKVTPEFIPDGGTRWSVVEKINNQSVLYKSVIINVIPYPVETAHLSPTLALELNALAEFNNIYLSNSDEYWPHLLMVQNIKTEKLAKYKSLNFSLDAHLLFDDKNIKDGYKKDLHAARFIVSLLVRNTLSGDSFWLNIPVYDDRFAQSPFGCQKCLSADNCYTPQSLEDKGKWLCPFDGERWSKITEKQGTHRMLFRLPSTAITSDNVQNGQWAHYSVDLIPYIKAGIQAAQDQEKLRGFSPSLMFYNLGLFTMGWEITGLNHAAMEIKNLSLAGY